MDINKINSYINMIDFDISDKKETTQSKEVNFGDFLTEALNKVNDSQLESQYYKELLAVGELDNLHDLTIAAEKASTSLELVMSIRTKIIEAYKEIMRIQI